MIRYELPFPLSVNNLFATVGRRRVRTDRYNKWAKEAGNCILAQGRKHLAGPVTLSVAVVSPDKRKRDLSNLLKSTEDLLVDMGVIEDDSLIRRISIQWVQDGPPCCVLVQPYEAPLAAG